MPRQPKISGYNCRQVAAQATGFLDNRLPAAANVAIWRHLDGCADCRTYIQQMALVRDSLKKMPAPKMPDATRKKLLQRLARMARDSGDTP